MSHTFDKKHQGSRKYSDKLQNLIRLHNNICFYCDQEIEPEQHSIDHVIPRSKGGPDVRDNRVLSCIPCNRIKGAEEDLDIVQIKLIFNR